MTRLAPLVVLAALAGCTGRDAPPEPAAPADPFGRVEAQSVWPGLEGADLLAALRADYTPERTLGYDRARDLLFAHDMRTAGHLRDPYTGYELVLPPGDPSTVAFRLGMNTEHTWPQSKGARDEPLKSDMHHLYPVRDEVNSSRNNLPYGEIPDERADAWYTLDVSQSNPPDVHRERWSERGMGRWEPRDDDKGNVARAVFYVYALYGPRVAPSGGDAFFAGMRTDLLAWNRADPVDAAETARSAWIATQQGTPNPFVLDPTLADRAFGAGIPTTARAVPPRSRSPQFGPSRSTPSAAPAGDVWIAALHYDNAGADRGEAIALAGLPGLRLDGWRLVLVNGTDGRVYDTLAPGGSIGGDGCLVVSVDGLQNGPADAVALVGPDGRVAEFVSYEGTVTATDGPAARRTSVDVGVEEGDGARADEWIVRDRRGGPWRLARR